MYKHFKIIEVLKNVKVFQFIFKKIEINHTQIKARLINKIMHNPKT